MTSAKPDRWEELCHDIGLALLLGQKVQFALAHYFGVHQGVRAGWNKSQIEEEIRFFLSKPMGVVVAEIKKSAPLPGVVHSYGSGIEAAMRLGNRQESDFPKKKHLERRITPVDIRALTSLNERLFEKSKKEYSFSPVWLLIRNAFALWDSEKYKQNKNDIYIPESHPFKQIWLLCDERSVGLNGILRLA